jgi:predicted nuclease of predicted toxin-antitoxin system
MRFKVDENLPDEVVAVLREEGHDAATVREQALAGRPDDDVASVCKRERRAILTLDLGFSDIRAFPPEEFAGLIVFRVGSQTASMSCAYSETAVAARTRTARQASLDRRRRSRSHLESRLTT